MSMFKALEKEKDIVISKLKSAYADLDAADDHIAVLRNNIDVLICQLDIIEFKILDAEKKDG